MSSISQVHLSDSDLDHITERDESKEQPEHADVGDLDRSKIDSYDIESAIRELELIIDDCSNMYQRLKQIKYEYLNRTYELYSRIDFPTVMMNACRKEVIQNVPDSKSINTLDFD